MRGKRDRRRDRSFRSQRHGLRQRLNENHSLNEGRLMIGGRSLQQYEGQTGDLLGPGRERLRRFPDKS